MASTRRIQVRRRTVGNIHKLTRTMEMIATARYKRTQDWVLNLRPYIDHLSRMVHHLVSQETARADQPLLSENPQADSDALVVMSSNRGMCGGYNGAILRRAMQQYRQLRDAGRQVDVYALGAKAISYFRFQQVEPLWQRPQFEGRAPIEEVADLAESLIDRFIAGQLGAVHVAHTHYISKAVQQPTVFRLLPLGELGSLRETDTLDPPPRRDRDAQYDFMPEPREILEMLLPRTVGLQLYQAVLDSMLSEQVARMTAMRLACQNAEDMTSALTMEYNRARQGAITNELAEIIGGAEALG